MWLPCKPSNLFIASNCKPPIQFLGHLGDAHPTCGGHVTPVHGFVHVGIFGDAAPTLRPRCLVLRTPGNTQQLPATVDEGRDDVPTGVHGQRFDAVVAAASRGDEAAIADLFTELNPRLVRFLAGRSGQAGDDLAGEVWMAVAKGIGQFEGDWDDFRKWFFVIARKRVADHHRSNKRRRAILESNASDLRWSPAAPGPDEAALDHLSGDAQPRSSRRCSAPTRPRSCSCEWSAISTRIRSRRSCTGRRVGCESPNIAHCVDSPPTSATRARR